MRREEISKIPQDASVSWRQVSMNFREGGLFQIEDDMGRNLIPARYRKNREFHRLSLVFDENGAVAGIAGEIGACKYLLTPTLSRKGKVILQPSKNGYHDIRKEGNVYKGTIGGKVETIL